MFLKKSIKKQHFVKKYIDKQLFVVYYINIKYKKTKCSILLHHGGKIMEFLLYVCVFMFALGICGIASDFINKRVLGKKASKKVLVHVYAGESRYISYYAKNVLSASKRILLIPL
jgi:hypothetical protein